MADELKETVILDFTVDQGKAEKDLLALQAVIINNKKEQAELNKAYKAGAITQKEYLQENLRLQQNLKKEQEQTKVLTKLINTESNSRNALRARISSLVKEYDNLNFATDQGAKRQKELQAELTKLNTQFNKTSKQAGLFKDQIGNYPQAFQQAASSIRVAGVSVADIGTRLTALANPVTAAIGLVGALGSVYASSTLGAKDLAFAQSQLSEAFKLAGNAFANFLNISGEDGEGLFSRLTNEILTRYVPALASISKLLALTKEQLEDLGREELKIRSETAELLEENQELQTKIADEQVSINEKLEAAAAINANLVNAKALEIDILQKEIDKLNEIFAFDKANEELETQILQKTLQRDKVSTSINKKIEANNRLIDDLNFKLQEEIRLLRLVDELEGRKRTGADAGLTNINAANLGVATADQTADSTPEAEKRAKDLIEGNAQFQLTVREKLNADLLKLDEKAGIEEIRNKNAVAAAKVATDKATAAASAQILGEASELFNESTGAYKVLASAQTLISTYLAAQKAFEALAGIPIVGPGLGAAAAGLAIAQGLKRVATINGIEFFDGGYTGAGHPRQAAGVVHKNEYVTPSKVVNRPEAQPHLQALERMRGGYFDGGFVTNQNTSQAQQSLLMLNAIKRLPPGKVDVVEINRVQRRVEVREGQGRL